MKLLRDGALATPPRFDAQPLTPVILDALRAGRLTPEGQQRATDLAARLPGARAQQELAMVTLAATRPVPVRVAAAKGLLRHRQTFGALLPASIVQALREEGANPSLDPLLKEPLLLLTGVLGSEPRSTGDRLRDYAPAVPAPPPPAKKEE
jgi:hypothetical protein